MAAASILGDNRFPGFVVSACSVARTLHTHSGPMVSRCLPRSISAASDATLGAGVRPPAAGRFGSSLVFTIVSGRRRNWSRACGAGAITHGQTTDATAAIVTNVALCARRDHRPVGPTPR